MLDGPLENCPRMSAHGQWNEERGGRRREARKGRRAWLVTAVQQPTEAASLSRQVHAGGLGAMASSGRDQVKLMDEESPIMPVADGGFEQCDVAVEVKERKPNELAAAPVAR